MYSSFAGDSCRAMNKYPMHAKLDGKLSCDTSEDLILGPCRFCGGSDDPSKRTVETNVGLVNWRNGIKEGNTYPLCNMCYRTRQGRDFKRYVLCARGICMHQEEKRAMQPVSHQRGTQASRNPRELMSTIIHRQRIELTNEKCRTRPPRIEISELRDLLSMPCFYCGNASTGLDRVDSSGCYDIDNVVQCCKSCNSMKGDLKQSEFMRHMHKISKLDVSSLASTPK